MDLDFAPAEAPTDADLFDEVDLDGDVDAWVEQMLTAEDDQKGDESDPYGLGVDPYAEGDEVEKSEDEQWGDDSEDHSYSFEVTVSTVAPTVLTSAEALDFLMGEPTPADLRAALRRAGIVVGARGRLSTFQTNQAKGFLAAA